MILTINIKKLDVTDRDSVFKVVDKAITHFGTLDIVINSAGNMVMGIIEEFNEYEVRRQIETNFYGAL
jgi:NADP-dependent 3-hydroxy acid dehydrogenase YdfG